MAVIIRKLHFERITIDFFHDSSNLSPRETFLRSVARESDNIQQTKGRVHVDSI